MESLFFNTIPFIIPFHNDTFFVAETCDAEKIGITLDNQMVHRNTVARMTEAAMGNEHLRNGITRFRELNDALPGPRELVQFLEGSALNGRYGPGR
jgi:UDP:flavonoid glycosyltransferase YjiC (YdhE family)